MCKVSYLFLVFLIFLSGCAPKKIPPQKICVKEPEKIPSTPQLISKKVRTNTFQFRAPHLAETECILAVRNNIHSLEDYQQVFVKADGTLSLAEKPSGILSITFAPTILGESFDVYLFSKTHKLEAFLHLTPVPLLNVKRYGYEVTGEVLNRSGDFFCFTGTGFDPKEEVYMLARSNQAGQMIKLIAAEDGSISFIQNPASQGSSKGNGCLLIVGKKGEIEVKYPWGENLLNYSKTLLTHDE